MILKTLWKTLLFAKITTVAESLHKSIFENKKGQTDPYARPRRYFRTKYLQRRKNTYGRRFFSPKNCIAVENAVQYNFAGKENANDVEDIVEDASFLKNNHGG